MSVWVTASIFGFTGGLLGVSVCVAALWLTFVTLAGGIE